jgi:hypothetical protein
VGVSSHVAMVGIAMAVGRQKCFLDLIQEDGFLSSVFFCQRTSYHDVREVVEVKKMARAIR